MSICGRIACSLQDINLASVLRSGQSFRWTKLASDEWVGPLGHHVWILQQDKSGINFRTLPAVNGNSGLREDKVKAFIEDYFQLSINLPELYAAWSDADEAFRRVATLLPGVRTLRQDPVENLFCFICSSNNNIQRITTMVDKLCSRYGEPIAEYAGRAFHAFPSISALASDGVEVELRGLGFGYRARYIGETARQLADRGGEPWLHALRTADYPTCHAELRRLCGVGAKVADCVCLMSLDQTSAVPVDTHVHQLAARYYLPELRHVKTLTDRTYRQVADHFRTVFGERAGWAQAVLFCGDLNEFKKSEALGGVKCAAVASVKGTPKRPSQQSKARTVNKGNTALMKKRRSVSSVDKCTSELAGDDCSAALPAASSVKRKSKRRSKAETVTTR